MISFLKQKSIKKHANFESSSTDEHDQLKFAGKLKFH